MSYEAIYQVTRGLRMLLHSQLTLRSASAVVTLLPPGDKLPDVSGVNLYLYRVIESPFTKNRPWPGDRATPPNEQPALGLNMFYLITPLGKKPDDSSFEQGDDAHTMLGTAMLTLHEHPVLNDVHLPGFDADVVLPAFLLNSYEQIKICLVPTGLEELSKIWATINQPYRLSVAYEVSLVQLTPTPPPPVGGGIVQTTGVNVITLDPPRLTTLTPPNGALARVAGTVITPNTLRIDGFRLSFPGQTPLVRVGGQLAAIRSTPAPTDRSVTIDLPSTLDAGPQADVRVSLNQRTSTPLVFTASPWLAQLTPIRTALDSAAPQLVLDGIGFTNAPQAVRLGGPGGTTTLNAFGAGGSDTRATVTLPTTLANGVYDVRIVLADNSVSNARTLEVLPHLLNVAVAQVAVSPPAPTPVHALTLNGARLNGSDVRVLIDGVVHQHGANVAANQVIHTLGRLLQAGTHRVAVNVDGQTSHTVAMEV